MTNKIAVLLVGAQNSGKTSTINHFDTYYDEWDRTKKVCKVGWRHLQLHYKSLGSLISWIYFIPSSPTESRKSIKNRLGKLRPEMLLIAEQIDKGEKWNKYNETIEFLTQEGYEIKEFIIGDDTQHDTWRKWTQSSRANSLDNRAVIIGDVFREFIKHKII